jgi:hypothetical protein
MVLLGEIQKSFQGDAPTNLERYLKVCDTKETI